MGQGKANLRVEISQKTFRDPLVSLRDAITRRPGFSPTFAGEEPPLRAELFSREQMAQHGRVLAGSHRLGRMRGSDRLLTRLAQNETLITAVRALLNEAVNDDRRITPAGEWLLDNFYLIEAQIRTARRHLPPGYSRELPRLADGPSAALPRVYDIALETISHGDGRLDTEGLGLFVSAYQTMAPLTIGELWAIPIMLRLALLENLRRVAARIGADRVSRNGADYWADLMTAIAEKDPKSLILLIADMARSDPPMVGSFVAEFARRLQGKSPALALPLTWIEQRLSDDGLTIEHLVQSENQQQAADQVSISNSISSLRFLGASDWRDFVEARSVVERTLREDPVNVYPLMDFATRDQYRHVVETTARRSGQTEGDVATLAIRLARDAAATALPDAREAHVGYYLVGPGLPQLERAAHARFSIAEGFRRACLRHPLMLYLGTIFALTVLPGAAVITRMHADGAEGRLLALVGLFLLLCTGQVAVAVVNALVPRLATPRALPKMDLSEGIPPDSRTLVVVPTMITSAQNVEHMIEALEVRFLGNRDGQLAFGLLTDLADAAEETLPEDEALECLAVRLIDSLNEKYPVAVQHGASPQGPFFLFHRPRRWNPAERVWMGYERKRGKLADLNGLLRGQSSGQFSRVVGDTGILQQVKYVITLDADTQLPRDAARLLVGAMMHPLNRALYDKGKGRVTEGYGILQPRVAVSLTGANRSRYARLWASEPGIDPYTRIVSDVYQDLFGEGSFIGKGIYDVDAFELAVGGRLPENRILSHDLLEGCYVRAGLVTDVQVYEESPSRYDEDVRRRYRWIRGDWQLWRWLLPAVPGREGRRVRNPLSALSRWKLLDNLRRSVAPAGLLGLLLVSWAVLSPAWGWTLAGIGCLLLPVLVASLPGLVRRPEDVPLATHLETSVRSLGRQAAQALLVLACLPYEVFFSLDAALRTVARLLVTHRRLLQWTPSGDRADASRQGLAGAWTRMWIAPAVACVTGVWLWMARPSSLAVAVPILLLWSAAPVITWHVSRPMKRRGERLTADQLRFLHSMARKTWGFFDTYVGPADHWLPPDNYQELPALGVAHRTSPTNMGLALLANLSAHDFGYLSTGRLVDRTTRAFQAMSAMERHRGHFYNWYDTLSLVPLEPRYISSVDSGNLAGHLLTLRPGLIALAGEPILPARAFQGLRDTIEIVAETTRAAPMSALSPLQQTLHAACEFPPQTIAAGRLILERLAVESRALATALTSSADHVASRWASAAANQCRDILGDLACVAPWEGPSAPATPQARVPEFTSIPTLEELAALDSEWAGPARARIAAIAGLAARAVDLADMEWDFLFDRTRQVLSIGYNVADRRRDSSYYDLLASEARLSTFVAIAQGHLPQESWFALGRLLTTAAGEPVLLSWSGSMFEYLMPLVVMPGYDETLLDQTCKAAVKRQIEYGRHCGVPWGISESGYNLLDVRLAYQYRAFGVPGLGLKRGLADDLVVAPYASALALMVSPAAACSNLQRLAADGFEGDLGFYEAIDYTPTRLPRGHSHALVRAYMAHHQGMTFLSLAQVLLDGLMQKRFASDPAFQATALLLQERIPRVSAFYLPATPASDARTAPASTQIAVRSISGPDTPAPEVQLLSNGRYHLVVTNAGGGYSRWKEFAVTRWREDATSDNWGTFCYLRDVSSGAFWSAAHQPTLQPADRFEVVFSEARAEFRSRSNQIESYLEIAVSPEDDVELRRLRLTNCGRTRRMIEVTTYAEVALAAPAADALHPAFSNLFVQTEVVPDQRAILCTRRPRSRDESSPWMFHLMAAHGASAGSALSYETDRLRFLGRGRTPADPRAMRDFGPLSGATGSVLDPIVAIRGRYSIEPDESITIDIVSGVAETRGACLGLVSKYQDRRLANRVFALASTHAQVVLRQLNASESDAHLYCRLASSIIYANPSLRADPAIVMTNRRGQSALWGSSVSGDLPIVLLQIGDAAHIDLVRQLVQAHAYWRLKGLAVDLVIWNEDRAGYRQSLQEQIIGLIASGVETNAPARPGAVFVRPAEQISNEDRVLFQSVARVIITDVHGSLADQIAGRQPDPPPTRFTPTRVIRASDPAPPPLPRGDLVFFNGRGGFTPDGREYIITTGPETATPAPWVNVLANPGFGTVISESGSAYSWAENAHEFRLTPWNNDPVTDAGGEAIYVRDEESGRFWSPTPLPAGTGGHYTTRHGFGYSVFEHTEDGITSELWVYVDLVAPVKWSVLKLRNGSGRARRLSATGYVEWVLGDLRGKSAQHVVTTIDSETGAIFAENTYNAEFAGRTAFFDAADASSGVCGDRTEFIGRNGTLRQPAAMLRSTLSGRVGGALDPCAAIQVVFALDAGEEREIVFRLGAGRGQEDAAGLVRRARGSAAARRALEEVWEYWNHTLGVINVDTPDAALNTLANGWLLYQTVACRLWGRSGLYQSGGAFGFRDQLQDVMALVHAEPPLVRQHLLLCASRQFPEGDVQHWWHPPGGRGVRTHCSDDYLWLPMAACRYVAATGDAGVLDEMVAFVEGRAVNPEEDSYYDLPATSENRASLYTHCVRAIVRGLQFGAHGLPLIGSGDWNDGMNLVGAGGRGESVWLGFFLYAVLMPFADLARRHNDAAFADRCLSEATKVRLHLEENGWDGSWYRRAYFDDGSPLGSSSNLECQIDSIAQSWSVLSGAADPARARTALDAVDARLVRRDDGLVRLLDPPFDTSTLDPGYIKGYVPGVRENGGQYTHAAIWAAMAFAELGDARRAWDVWRLINPLAHGASPAAIETYKVEPYVVAADVYAVDPHVGRGGWTWYTGSAAWMYRLIIESLLGVTRLGDQLRIAPCLPADWHGFTVHYRYGETVYHVVVHQTPPATGAERISVDGRDQVGMAVALANDRVEHGVEVWVRSASRT
ncbi:MAG: cyclic beta 1-2 glucan synthetase [Acidobacteria bacterium]|nr:cyclic beta 1-2 glucan synthetase [Acidobacteriota bacterium]